MSDHQIKTATLASYAKQADEAFSAISTVLVSR